LFNAHYDERCFLPIHVYDTATGRPVAMILRQTPSGVEVRGHLRRLVRRIRRHWPTTRITIRGDGHYCRPEVMDWREANGIDYVFGLPGTNGLAAKVDEVADAIRVERAVEDRDVVRGFAETTHAAKSWKRQRRVVARIEATRLGLDIRYVVTSVTTGTAEWVYADFYCARGQAENLIKLHKAQLASDRTSCRAATANQMRLVLHTAAYWLVLAVRERRSAPIFRTTVSLRRAPPFAVLASCQAIGATGGAAKAPIPATRTLSSKPTKRPKTTQCTIAPRLSP
jgi:hypothetical protein